MSPFTKYRSNQQDFLNAKQRVDTPTQMSVIEEFEDSDDSAYNNDDEVASLL